MWLPNDILAEVDELATFRYIDLAETRRWNDHKRDGELRLLTVGVGRQRTEAATIAKASRPLPLRIATPTIRSFASSLRRSASASLRGTRRRLARRPRARPLG